jgi:hypothetical protein
MIRTNPPKPKIGNGKRDRVLARMGSGLGRRWVSPFLGAARSNDKGWYRREAPNA